MIIDSVTVISIIDLGQAVDGLTSVVGVVILFCRRLGMVKEETKQ